MLTAYFMGKPVRESWLSVSVIGDLSKLEIKALSGFLQSIVLVGLLPFYTKLYDLLPRGKLLLCVNLFFVITFPIFYFVSPGLLNENIPYVGVGFYVWIGIFSVMVVAQFWAFAADLYDDEAGKRLFPLIAIGAALGAILGSILTNFMIDTANLDNYAMLFFAPIPLALATWLLWHVDKEEYAKDVASGENLKAPPEDPRSAWRIITGNRYILLIALFIFMLNWIVTNGENILFAAVQDNIAQMDVSGLTPKEVEAFVGRETTQFYSKIYFWVNLIGLLLQAFVVSRLLKFGGLAGILLVPPVVSLASTGAMGAASNLTTFTAAKTAENATNHSVANTARNILWLPVPKAALYKAKTAVDTICVRLADALAAATVISCTRFSNLSVKNFLMINFVLIVVWIIVALLILRERRRWDQEKRKGLV